MIFQMPIDTPDLNLSLMDDTDCPNLSFDDIDFREHMLLKSLDTKEEQVNEATPKTDFTSPNLMEEQAPEHDSFPDMTEKQEATPALVSPSKSAPASANLQQPEVNTTAASTTSVSENEEQPLDGPGKCDVLCGQSRICASHSGNRRFQSVLDLYARRYDLATSKQEKMCMTKEIVACISDSGGRFLKYKEGSWQQISDVTARDKVSHALRTKVSSWKRQQKHKDKSRKATTTKQTHRRRRNSSRRSSASTATSSSASDIITSSFDASDSASASVMGDLLKTQREIFANMTQDSIARGNLPNAVHPLKL